MAFCCFLAKTVQKSFFLEPLLEPWNIALKFRTKVSINSLQEEYSMEHFWFCLKDVYENFEEFYWGYWICQNAVHLHPCHPQQQRAVTKTSSLFLWFPLTWDMLQDCKVVQNSVTELLSIYWHVEKQTMFNSICFEPDKYIYIIKIYFIFSQ